MDKEKDIKSFDKRHLAIKNEDISTFLKAEPLPLYIYKKTQKFTAALYLLTELIERDTPLRTKIRELAGLLLSEAFAFMTAVPRTPISHDFRSHTLEIMTTLETAYFSNLISEINFHILKSGYLPVLTLFEEHVASKNFSPSFLREEFFEVEAGPTDKSHKGHIGQNKGQSDPFRPRPTVTAPNKTSNTSDKNHDRVEAILSILKKQPEVSVKDISIVIHGVSEKTLQRDLLSLVARGVLKKRGERRWSRYSIA